MDSGGALLKQAFRVGLSGQKGELQTPQIFPPELSLQHKSFWGKQGRSASTQGLEQFYFNSQPVILCGFSSGEGIMLQASKDACKGLKMFHLED